MYSNRNNIQILFHEQALYKRVTETVKVFLDKDEQYNGYHQDRRQYLYYSKNRGIKRMFSKILRLSHVTMRCSMDMAHSPRETIICLLIYIYIYIYISFWSIDYYYYYNFNCINSVSIFVPCNILVNIHYNHEIYRGKFCNHILIKNFIYILFNNHSNCLSCFWLSFD